MVGIAVISHGALCEGIVDSAGMIAGEIAQSKTVSLRPGMQPDDYRGRVKDAIEELDDGDGVLVLADIAGGTPYNSCAILMKEMDNIAVVTGLNLPMVVSVTLEREADTPLEALVKAAQEAGVEGVKVLQTGRRKAAEQNEEEEDL